MRAAQRARRFVVFLFGFSCCRNDGCRALSPLSSHSSRLKLLAKTTETFKLADLQYLQADLEAGQRKNFYQLNRLCVDRSTGSSLFQLELYDELVFDDETNIPSSLRRCDWIAQVLAQGATVHELIENVRSLNHFRDEAWAKESARCMMDYIRMDDVSKQTSKVQSPTYTSKMLLCRLAQEVCIPAALHPTEATDRLLVVETGESHGILLVRQVPLPKLDDARVKKWAQRPYLYSSAMNAQAADILVDIMLDLLKQMRNLSVTNSTIRLLDPTCGSGTFLAFARDRGVQVEGWDIRQSCVEGTKRNLDFVFGETPEPGYRVRQRDAEEPMEESEILPFDCCIANLPWGQNTVLYSSNFRILQNLASFLGRGAPCAFITKTQVSKAQMEQIGFKVLGTAHIPQQNFQLPKGRKAKRKNDGDDEQSSGNESSSKCVVTVALAPET